MRPFTDFERNNLVFLVNHNIPFTQVEVTPTGLSKSILDATAPMRAFFLEHSIHNYDTQQQGPEHKTFLKAVILTKTEKILTKCSFYRPITKKGDPRMWIYKLGSYSQGNDIHVCFTIDKVLYSINITHIDINSCYNSSISTPIKEVLSEIIRLSNSVANELLSKFLAVKGRWFESEVLADTGIGRTIETFLGIPMNCGKTPDYKGIELKSHRSKRSSHKNVLFTQTPDWDISIFDSGKSIVEAFGYITKTGHKTYQNTVQCRVPNSQSLLLNVNQIKNILELQHLSSKIEDVAAWRLIKLHERLLTKHHETFWIEVENQLENNKEYFRYKFIEHTRNPNVGQFDILLEQQFITVDLLLCRPSGRGDTYSFKIKKKGMPLLFPESEIYTI